MPSTYSRNLRLELIGTGEQPGTWGETTNINLQALDDSLDGFYSQAIGQSAGGNALTITTDNAPAMSAGRSRILEFHGDVGSGGTVTIAPNDAEKWYFVRNTASGPITFQQGSGAVYKLEGGCSAVIHCTGTGSEASVYGTLSSIQFDNLTVTGTAKIKGAVTMEGSLSVTGVSTLTGAVSCGGALSVTGATTLSSTLGVTGAVTMSSTLGVTGNTTVGGTLGVTGAIDCASVNAVGAVAAGSLSSVGNASVGGTLGVIGKTSLAGGLDFYVDGSDAAYDMYFRSAAAAPNTGVARLPIGAAGLYLRATASGPQWQGLVLPADTPISGFDQGDVLFGWDNKIAQGRISVLNYPGDTEKGTVLLIRGITAGGELRLDGDGANSSPVVRYQQAGVNRWAMGSRTLSASVQGTWALVRFDNSQAQFVNFEMVRENGRILLGYIDHQAEHKVGSVNIMPPAGEMPLVVTRYPGSQSHLTLWQDSGGNPLAWIDSDGIYHGGGQTAWIHFPRTASWYALTGVTAGAMFFYSSTPAGAQAGGFLSFGYGLSGAKYGTFYAQLPISGAEPPAPATGGLMWAYRGSSQPPLAYATFDEYIRFNDEELFLRLLKYPDLMDKLKERLAAL